MTAIATAALEDAIKTKLAAEVGSAVPIYDGIIPGTPPVMGGTDQRVKPYIAWWGGSDLRDPTTEPLEPAGSDDVTWTGRLTIVAGIASHLGPVVTKVTRGLHQWDIPLDGASTSLLRVSYVAEMRIDRSETPNRLYRLVELEARAGL